MCKLSLRLGETPKYWVLRTRFRPKRSGGDAQKHKKSGTKGALILEFPSNMMMSRDLDNLPAMPAADGPRGRHTS
ncbi:protein of unknown function [Nitrospira japonica]|uniref:Uncharacterized protein n=1 Tax=Nitrospira japonica TaxID=1325564 RepID=A0A1W1I8H0_9BACT|nr:protein of unknown function [Nitrospira japonica]